jgi:vacuolar protein sorting-associated protein 13A/C
LNIVPGEGLATIALYFFSLKGQKLADGSLSTAIILCDVHLDDTRPNREKKITRFMERRQLIDSTSSFDENNSIMPTRSMIDVTFNMKDSDIFADVKVFSFNLIIYLDFLLKVSNFFQTPPLTEEQEFAQKQQQAQTIRKSSSTRE